MNLHLVNVYVIMCIYIYIYPWYLLGFGDFPYINYYMYIHIYIYTPCIDDLLFRGISSERWWKRRPYHTLGLTGTNILCVLLARTSIAHSSPNMPMMGVSINRIPQWLDGLIENPFIGWELGVAPWLRNPPWWICDIFLQETHGLYMTLPSRAQPLDSTVGFLNSPILAENRIPITNKVSFSIGY